MMRSLWTSATGMTSQQQNVDTISNNFANVSTFGYKRERMEFKSLLYETMQRASLDPVNNTGRPVNLQVGHGVRPIATSRVYTQGNLQVTDIPTDFAIEGDGFFVIRSDEDTVSYTKDGAMKISRTLDGELMLTTSEGYPYLSVDDEPIIIPGNVMMKDLTVSEEGLIYYMDTNNVQQELGYQFNIVQFPNVQGLEAIGGNLLRQTAASGDPLMETEGEVNRVSSIRQGTLEMSNVQVAEEMINLIVAQRAYELNSKAIQTSDDMLQLANNLKR